MNQPASDTDTKKKTRRQRGCVGVGGGEFIAAIIWLSISFSAEHQIKASLVILLNQLADGVPR